MSAPGAGPPRLHTTPEAAALLNVPVNLLKTGATSRTMQHTRIGRKVYWSDADLAAVVAAGQQVVVSPIRRRRVMS